MSIRPHEVQAATDGDNGPTPRLSPQENAPVSKVLQRFARRRGTPTEAALPALRDESKGHDANTPQVDGPSVSAHGPRGEQDLET